MLFREGNFLISHRVLFQRYCHLPLLSCYHHSTSQSFTSVPLTLIRRRYDAAIPSFITGSIQFLIFACVFPTLLRWLIYGFVTPERLIQCPKKSPYKAKAAVTWHAFFQYYHICKVGNNNANSTKMQQTTEEVPNFYDLVCSRFLCPLGVVRGKR